jgi:hypothetical protein
MIARLSETLQERQDEIRVGQLKYDAVKQFLQLLGRPLGCSESHKMMACWVGVTRPAYQAAIPQVLSKLSYRVWRCADEENSFIFDLGDGEERDDALGPLLELVQEDLDDCGLCQKTVKAAVTFVRSKYPKKKDIVTRRNAPVLTGNHQEITGKADPPIVSDSRLFNISEASICLLSRTCDVGRRTRYRVHKQLALASSVIRNLLEHQNLDDTQANIESIIEIEQTSAALDAVFNVLYSGEFGGLSIPTVPSLANADIEQLALGYVALKELGYECFIDRVRGSLRCA